MYYFSPTTSGFYHFKLHKKIPNDAIEISEEEYNKLMDGQCDGKHIVFLNGKISLQEKIESSEEIKNKIYKTLEYEMKNYLFVIKGYTESTQTSLQIISTNTKFPKKTRDNAKRILEWIIQDVLNYYYTKKEEIMNSDNPIDVKWDFNECEKNAPQFSLKNLLK